jgi:hypothetical protein
MPRWDKQRNKWVVQWYDDDGDRHTLRFDQKGDAEEAELRIKANKQRERAGLEKRGTAVLFFDYAQIFIRKRMREYPASTWMKDARNLRNYWFEKFGARELAGLTRMEIKNHLDWIQLRRRAVRRPTRRSATTPRSGARLPHAIGIGRSSTRFTSGRSTTRR